MKKIRLQFIILSLLLSVVIVPQARSWNLLEWLCDQPGNDWACDLYWHGDSEGWW